MSYLPTKGFFSGKTALLFHKLQWPCYFGHTAGSTFRNLRTKGRGGNAVSGGPKPSVARPGYLV